MAAAFEEDLGRLGERAPTARVLLEALAWARGPGLPRETIWVPVARALASLRGEVQLGQMLDDGDVSWLLERAGRYVVEGRGPGGQSLFRPLHNELGEYLRARSTTAGDDTTRVEAALTAALLDTLGPSGGRRWDRAHPYLRTYLGEHALGGGSDVFSALLSDNGFLAAADPSTLTPLLSQALPEQDRVVRSYRRARPLLGEDPATNAAHLQEAALAVSGTAITFADTAVSPAYRTKWTHVRPDHSLLTFPGDAGPANSVVFGAGAGGRALLACAGEFGKVRVWDAETGDPVLQPLTGSGRGISVAFGTGPKGQALLAAGSRRGIVWLWDLETGTAIWDPGGWDYDSVSEIAFGIGARGRALVASNIGEGVPVCERDSCTQYDWGEPLPGSTGSVTSLAFGTGAGGRALLAAGVDDGLLLWDPDTRAPVVKYPLGGERVWSLAFGVGAGGRALLAAGGGNGTIRLWDLGAGAPLGQPMVGHVDRVCSVAFGTGAGGRALLASAGDDETVRLWDPDTGAPLGQPLIGHVGPVRSVAFGTGAGARALLASGGDDGTVRLWDPDTVTPPADLNLRIAEVRAIAFGGGAAGQALLATGGRDGAVRLWDRHTGAPVGQPLTGHAGAVMSVAVAAGAGGRTRVASVHGRPTPNYFHYEMGDDGGTALLWDGGTGKLVRELPVGDDDKVWSVTFGAGAGGRALLACGSEGSVWLLDPDTGTLVEKLLVDKEYDRVGPVAFGTRADGQALLACGGQGNVWLWELGTDTPVQKWVTGDVSEFVTSVALGSGAGGRTLLAVAASNGMWLFDAYSDRTDGRQLIASGRGTDDAVWVAFGTGAGGRPLLTSAGKDGTVRLWDPETDARLTTIRRRMPAASLASDGSIFAIGDQEGLSVIDMS
jgi:WD40 repeat protein